MHRSTSELDLHHYHDPLARHQDNKAQQQQQQQQQQEDKKKRGRSPFRFETFPSTVDFTENFFLSQILLT